ncbi:MAG: V-type ATP synthase subunit E [Candidatus Thorarchaeota archaeon]
MSQTSAADTIRQTIIQDAKVKAKQIVEEAKVLERKLTDEASQNAQASLAGWAERRRQMARGIGDRVIGKARSDAHMRVLDARARMIEVAFGEAKKRFENERIKVQYKKFLKTLIINAGVQIGGGDIVVLSQKSDQANIMKITGMATEISKGSGHSTKITTDKRPIEMLGGVIVQNKAGNITVDYRLETLLDQVAQQYRNEIQRALFPEDAKTEGTDG